MKNGTKIYYLLGDEDTELKKGLKRSSPISQSDDKLVIVTPSWRNEWVHSGNRTYVFKRCIFSNTKMGKKKAYKEIRKRLLDKYEKYDNICKDLMCKLIDDQEKSRNLETKGK
jgi:hypothetical protein